MCTEHPNPRLLKTSEREAHTFIATRRQTSAIERIISRHFEAEQIDPPTITPTCAGHAKPNNTDESSAPTTKRQAPSPSQEAP